MAQRDLKAILADGEALIRVGIDPDGFDPATQVELNAAVALLVPKSGSYAAATTDVQAARVTGDTSDRFIINADGKIEWGPGNAALDTNLYRAGVNTLKSDGSLHLPSSADSKFTAAGSTAVPLTLQGAPSQTGDLQRWLSDGGTVLARISAGGGASFDRNGTQGVGMGGLDPLASTSLSVGTVSASWVPIRVRGATSQTANLQQWQNSGGTVLATVGADGYGSFGVSAYSDQVLTAKSAAASHKGLVIQGAASQTADLTQWLNSAGTKLAAVRSDGGITDIPVLSGRSGTGYIDWTSGSYMALALSSSTTSVPLAIRGAASQAANLQEWQNSAGTILLAIKPDGGIKFDSGAGAGATAAGMSLYGGTGAPVNASGTDGDIYLRLDGGSLTTIYQRRAGAWVGIV